jgi:predicted tellurium resistance membrane protein TerC
VIALPMFDLGVLQRKQGDIGLRESLGLCAHSIAMGSALGGVLIFIGSMIVIAGLLAVDRFPPAMSLSITFAILGSGFVCSLWKTRSHLKGEAR